MQCTVPTIAVTPTTVSAPDIQPLSYVNETDSSPELLLNMTSIEMGDTLKIQFGMKNSTDDYIAGYNVSLYLNSSDIFYFITNATTTNMQSNIQFPLFHDKSVFPAGDYGIIMNVSTINRGTLQAYAPFTIFQNSDANLVFSLTLVGHVNFRVNRTEVIQLRIQNIGNGSAYNISVVIQQITNPIGEIIGDLFPINSILLLKGGEIMTYAFEILPITFGVGRLDLLTSYVDATGINTIGTTGLDVVVLPTIVADISAGELIQGNSSRFDVTLTNAEPVAVSLLVTLSSDKILFKQSQFEITSLMGTQTIEFLGTILSTGQVRVTLSVSFIDPDGGEEAIVLRYATTFVIAEGTILPLSPPPQSNLWIPFFYGTLLTLIIVLGITFILYFRPRWRYKVLMKLIPEKMNVELDLSNNGIIIDGSNVAWDSPTPNHRANLDNLLTAIEHLKKIGFTNVTVVVDAALRYQVEDKAKFDQASREGVIKVLPAKVSGDLFILRLSNQTGALILTNDLFREFREEFTWIDERRVPFSFINGEFFLHPIAE